MSSLSLPRVLCVDDEPRVVQGLLVHLRNRYQVMAAHSGSEALDVFKRFSKIAVVISDMRMPGMDGAALLEKVREVSPDTTRILLTGESSRDAVVAAVNKGQIYRFLTKPCAPDTLNACVDAAVGQYRLVTAEKVLLQQTLIGCIDALVDLLCMTNPIAFGRASRIRREVMGFADHLQCAQGYWQLEAAAMLSQIGYLSVPTEVLEKVLSGASLTVDEQKATEAVSEVAGRLLEHIPRLDPVIQILQATSYNVEQLKRLGNGTIGLGARILRLVIDFDALGSQGHADDTALQMLGLRADLYGTKLLADFGTYIGNRSSELEVVEIPLRLLRPEMTILQDVRTEDGVLLVARGFEVTDRFVERIKSFAIALLSTKVKVGIPATRARHIG